MVHPNIGVSYISLMNLFKYTSWFYFSLYLINFDKKSTFPSFSNHFKVKSLSLIWDRLNNSKHIQRLKNLYNPVCFTHCGNHLARYLTSPFSISRRMSYSSLELFITTETCATFNAPFRSRSETSYRRIISSDTNYILVLTLCRAPGFQQLFIFKAKIFDVDDVLNIFQYFSRICLKKTL